MTMKKSSRDCRRKEGENGLGLGRKGGKEGRNERTKGQMKGKRKTGIMVDAPLNSLTLLKFQKDNFM